jgi:excinuclease UvrABC ATPase subunit
MRRWDCRECQGKDLTIRLDELRIYLECDSCNDTRWVKR